jgi:hypothetical protein
VFLRLKQTRWTLIPLLWIGCMAFLQGAEQKVKIVIDPSQGTLGRTFEGIGAVSAGASSRLLIDYPEPYRSQILDFLFKPNWGASLQHLKVEIGGDVDSTDGSEPSHMHARGDENYQRGYEWWLMKEARKRNPDIILEALEWGAPGWIGDGHFFSEDNIEYILRFLEGAQRIHKLRIDYVGIWNETPYEIEWIKKLKKTLTAHGLSTKVAAADQVNTWDIVDTMRRDANLANAVDVVAIHYPGKDVENGAVARMHDRFDKAVDLTGFDKPIWSSEDGPWRGDWQGALFLAKTYNRNYLLGKMTKTEIWSPVTSYYDIFPLPGSGLMRANAPWCGHFEVQPAIWATAHTTQFVSPGWRYLDAACGFLPGKGSFVTLISPEKKDISLVIETADASAPQLLELSLKNKLAAKLLHVWRTNVNASFQKMQPIVLKQGQLSFSLEPNSIYSFTTTTNQKKGKNKAPALKPFLLPYHENFESYSLSRQARYFSDTTGAFEVQNCQGSRGGLCYEQVVDRLPIRWHYAAETLPVSLIGDNRWENYRAEAKVFFPASAEGILLGRVSRQEQSTGKITGYQLHLLSSGEWMLTRGNSHTLATGKIVLPVVSWHTMCLEFQGDQIQAWVNGEKLAHIHDSGCSRGLAGIGVAGWQKIQFDDFSVRGLTDAPRKN